MRETLAGTGALIRLGLRRDRWLLPSWVVALALMAGFAASAAATLYPDEAARVEAATILNSTSSTVAMFGRVYDPTSLGALSMIKYTAFMAAAVAILMVIVTIRHTRAEEESGRLELVSGGRVGRNAPLVAAFIIVFGACASLAVLTGAALAASGLPVEGSFAFGLGWGATGMAFGAVAAVTAQLTTSARAATGMGMTAIAVAYLLRGFGDLADPGPSIWSWLSPIGWNQQVRAFAGDRWWVFAFPAALCLMLIPGAFLLRARRDLGGGLRQDRRGPARGALKGVGDLAVHLHVRVVIAWAITVVVFGFLIGSLVTSVDDFLSSPGAVDLIERLGGTDVLTDAFLGAEIGIVGIMISAYGISAANRLRSEETGGHAEAVLGTATTRGRWAASHAVAALGGIALLLLLLGLSVGAGAAVALGDSSQVGRLVLTGAAQIPAAWVVVGIALALFGCAPRLKGVAWGVFAAFVALKILGDVLNAPQWVMNLSPYQHSPALTVEGSDTPALIALLAVAGALATVGHIGWRRRDLAP